MDVLNYTIKENLANHHAYLTELKNFALAQGWTVVRHLTNVQWAFSGGIWQFIAGSESFLELQSSGYGAQTLHFRFRAQNTGHATNEYIETMGHLGNTTLQNVSTHPVDQTGAWTSSGLKFMGLPPTTITKVWFFGNIRFLYAVIQLDADYIEHHAFGSLKLHDTSIAQGNFCGWIQSGATAWTAKTQACPFDTQGQNIYYNSALQTSAQNKQNFVCGTNNIVTASAFDNEYSLGLIPNAYAQLRPIVVQKNYQIDSGDSQWFNFAEYPVGRVWTENLAIGQELTYGTAKYLVFPNTKQATGFLGTAVKVAA